MRCRPAEQLRRIVVTLTSSTRPKAGRFQPQSSWTALLVRGSSPCLTAQSRPLQAPHAATACPAAVVPVGGLAIAPDSRRYRWAPTIRREGNGASSPAAAPGLRAATSMSRVGLTIYGGSALTFMMAGHARARAPADRLSGASLRGRTERRMLIPMPTDDQVTATLGGHDYGETLWEPTERTVRDARITHYAAWLAGRSWSRSVRIRRALALVGGGTRRVLVIDLGLLRRARPPRGWPGAGGRADAGRDLVRRDHAQLCAQRAAHGPGASGPYRGHLPVGVGTGRNAELRRTRRGSRQSGCGAAGARRHQGRPGRRLPAQHPRGAGRLARRRQPGRHLVVVLAGFRAAQRDRPAGADLAQGADRGRRLPVQREVVRPAAAGRGHRGRAAQPGGPDHGELLGHGGRGRRRPIRRRGAAGDAGSGAAGLGFPARRRRGGPGRVRGGAVRAPAVGAVLVGHHRAAQADRARSRRRGARASEIHGPASRPGRATTRSSGTPPPAG